MLESVDADHERQLTADDGDGKVLVDRRRLRCRPADKCQWAIMRILGAIYTFRHIEYAKLENSDDNSVERFTGLT